MALAIVAFLIIPVLHGYRFKIHTGFIKIKKKV